MILRSLFVLALCATTPAAAQTTTSPDPAIRALSAIWRPIGANEAVNAAAVLTACEGAVEEMASIEAALPETITPEALARIRAPRGLLVVPAEEAGRAYFFPGPSTPWFTSGLAAVAALSEAEGLIGVRDAGNQDVALQLGAVGGRPVLRVRGPDRAVHTFIGCARVPE
ncbi:MAG: hypothetical protein K2P58_10555 [Hyphomonadaceae bacterium]|nr:hypothetical protein [Hyphomonadaceae bacterium]